MKASGYREDSNNTLAPTIRYDVGTTKSNIEDYVIQIFQEDQRNWDQLLPVLTMAYQSAIHEGTGCTPNELTFGWDARLPVDLVFVLLR